MRQVGKWIIAAVLLAGAGRFAYSLTASSQGWSGYTYMEEVYANGDRASVRPAARDGAERRWGPLFLLMMRAATRLSPSAGALRVSLRLFLTLLYGATVCLLYRLSLDAAPGVPVRRYLLVFLCCQSTAAIYAIANGMGEAITAFGVIAHFYCFVRKRYALAAALLCAIIYFKLFPIVFLFPYFVFSLLSRDHRRYNAYILASGFVLAVISIAAAGVTYGFFYPLAMIGDVMSDPRVIPIRSKEVFGLVFLVDRLVVSSFTVTSVLPDPSATRALARVFTALLLASTAAIAFILARYEHAWNVDADTRRVALVVFQSAIGFAIVSFSLDVSIAHLLPIAVSLYAPLLLFTDSGVAFALFGAGMLLAGNLIPLSLVLRLLPFGWLDRIAGNSPADLIPIEKFVWYQVPLAGVYCIGAALAYSLWRGGMGTRNARSPSRGPGVAGAH